MLGLESFAAIDTLGLSCASVNEINAEPLVILIPVAHFLATGAYGSRCDTALSKLFRKPLGLLSVLTLAIAACNPALAHWITSIRKPTQECSLGS